MRKNASDRQRLLVLGFPPTLRWFRLSESDLARIRDAAPDYEVIQEHDADVLASMVDDIEIAAGWYPRHLLARSPRLAWYQQWGAGCDWLRRHPEAVEAPFALTNMSGVHAVPASEHVFGCLLALCRGLPQAIRDQMEGHWRDQYDQVSIAELAGKRMLIVGLGAIGQRIARIAEALDMEVIGVRRHPDRGVRGVNALHPPSELLDLLPSADVVVVASPLTESTHHLFDDAAFARMKPMSFFINVARGGLVDGTALGRALSEGRIGAAAVDVLEGEPLPSDSPLWSLDRLLITSHYAGLSPRYNERALEILVDNLGRFRLGRPLRNVVDKRRGY
jgi:phosphoglycerate dehydrogenase-like enzyme